MNLFQALLLGLVQGVTEFLPISSSGHLVLFQGLLQIEGSHLSFDIFLHLATLGAIIVYFGRSLLAVTKKEWFLVALGTIPAVIVGLIWRQQIESLFLQDDFLGAELILTGLINFYLDWQTKRNLVQDRVEIKDLGFFQSLGIGISQAIAIIPGISRSGATVAGGMMFGLSRQAAFKFSFLLAIPALLGAGVLNFSEISSQGWAEISWPAVTVGVVAAFISALLSLSLFKYVITQAKLAWFGWYCVILGLVILFL